MKKLFLKIKSFFSSDSFKGALVFFGALLFIAICCIIALFFEFRSDRREAHAAEIISYHWTSPLYYPRAGSLGPYDNPQSSPFYIECNTLDSDVFFIHNRVFTLGFLDEGSFDGNGNYIMYFTVYVYPSTALTIPVWFSGYDLFLNSDGDFELNTDFYEYREEYIQDPETLLPFLVQNNNVLGYAINNSASGSWDIPIRFCQFSFFAQGNSYQQSGYLRIAFPDLSILGSYIPHFIVSRSGSSQESFDLGYLDGYRDGSLDGQILGREEGFNEGYSSGYDEAYNIGYANGFDINTDYYYSLGYEDGYNSGLDDTIDDITPWSVVVNGMNNLFNTPLFGSSISLGTLFGIVFGVILVGIVIKIFLGG